MGAILPIQKEMTKLQDNVWESNWPDFHVQYVNGNPFLSYSVITVQVLLEDIEEWKSKTISKAKEQNEDVVFFQYNKWQIQYDPNSPRRFIYPRYCFIPRELD